MNASTRRAMRRRPLQRAYARDQYSPTPAPRKGRTRYAGSGDAGYRSRWARTPYVWTDPTWAVR